MNGWMDVMSRVAVVDRRLFFAVEKQRLRKPRKQGNKEQEIGMIWLW